METDATVGPYSSPPVCSHFPSAHLPGGSVSPIFPLHTLLLLKPSLVHMKVKVADMVGPEPLVFSLLQGEQDSNMRMGGPC